MYVQGTAHCMYKVGVVLKGNNYVGCQNQNVNFKALHSTFMNASVRREILKELL